MTTISKTFTFEAPKFSQSFSPFGSVGFCLPGLGPRGRGSRGKTPLHYAAENGDELVVQRLLEAKAVVDAKDQPGRGLGPGFGEGKPLEAMGSL